MKAKPLRSGHGRGSRPRGRAQPPVDEPSADCEFERKLKTPSVAFKPGRLDRRDHRMIPPRRASGNPFLDVVGSVRDYVGHIVKTATWRFTLACMLAFGSRLVPLPTDDNVTRSLLLLCAVSLGAVLGRPLDRKNRARRRSRVRRAVAAAARPVRRPGVSGRGAGDVRVEREP